MRATNILRKYYLFLFSHLLDRLKHAFAIFSITIFIRYSSRREHYVASDSHLPAMSYAFYDIELKWKCLHISYQHLGNLPNPFNFAGAALEVGR